jgi:hypothetical protein
LSRLSCARVELHEIRSYQFYLLQRQEQEDKLRNNEWERQANANARAAMLLEREMDRKHHDINREMAEENRRLAQELN